MYKTPFIIERADPQVYLHFDGYYYMCASVPKYDVIELRRAKSLDELENASVKNVWYKHDFGMQSELIWAPEIHYVEGSFYIYYAAASDKNQDERDCTFKHRMFAIKCLGQNPMTDEFVECGQIKTNQDSFSLDATILQVKNNNYYIWAQKEVGADSNSNIYLAKMISPTELDSRQECISKPEYAWETQGFKVNEGPAVLVHDERIFLTFSASATDENYCIGLMYADVKDDLTKKASWTKLDQPIMQTDAKNLRIGPGHNSFTYDENKNPLIVYHCRPAFVSLDEALYNPNRDMCIQPVMFDENKLIKLDKPSKMTWDR